MRPVKPVRRSCGTCQHWMQPDLSAEHIGNAGTCTFFEPKSGVIGDDEARWPFWARGDYHRTVSWEGKSCKTWEVRTKGGGYAVIPKGAKP